MHLSQLKLPAYQEIKFVIWLVVLTTLVGYFVVNSNQTLNATDSVLSLVLMVTAMVVVFLLILMLYFVALPIGMEVIVSLLIIMSVVLLVAREPLQLAIKKSKMTQALGLISNAKNNMAVYYASHGVFPDDHTSLFSKKPGKYTEEITLKQNTLVATLFDQTLSMRFAFSDETLPQFMLPACGYHELSGQVHYQGQIHTTFPPESLPFVCR